MIARHRRSYERDDFVFDPVHYLPLLERKTGALDQAAPLAGWEFPEEFGVLRRLLESRMGRRGKREFVQVLRLMESFRKEEVSSGPHHQDSGEAKIRESTAGVSRKPSSDGKACGCSSKHLCGLTAWNT